VSTHPNESRKSNKSPHLGALNIPELVRRGGLPSNVTPYVMGLDEHGAHIHLLGNSTTIVNEFVLTGLGREVASARHYVSIRPRCTAETIVTKYPNVGVFYSKPEIQQKILAKSLQSDAELAQEI